jgi:hypothetical protein
MAPLLEMATLQDLHTLHTPVGINSGMSRQGDAGLWFVGIRCVQSRSRCSSSRVEVSMSRAVGDVVCFSNAQIDNGELTPV